LSAHGIDRQSVAALKFPELVTADFVLNTLIFYISSSPLIRKVFIHWYASSWGKLNLPW